MKSRSPSPPTSAPAVKVIATNRKARHLYHFLETYEAGMVLEGPEVKSLRQGKATLVDAFGQFQRDQLFLVGLHIAAYDPANRWNSPPNRPRKLLMHRSELRRLFAKTTQRGLTLVPTRIYFKGSRVKVELALAQGKKTFDKREDLKRRDQKREMERALRAAR